MVNHEAELRESVFPSGAWEQGGNRSSLTYRMNLIADGSGLIPSDLNAERGFMVCLIVAPHCSSRTTHAVQLDKRSGPHGPDRHP